MAKASVVALRGDQVTNGAEETLDFSLPYRASVTISGVCPILFHRWNVEEVEAKSVAAKGSKAKKTDNTESYLYRNDAGEIALPGEYLRQSIIHAAKFKQGLMCGVSDGRGFQTHFAGSSAVPLTMLLGIGSRLQHEMLLMAYEGVEDFPL